LLNLLDDFNRERLGIEVNFSLPADRVIRSLDRIIEWRSKPSAIRMDSEGSENDPGDHSPRRCTAENIRGKLKKWAGKHGITILQNQPGQPQQNSFVGCHNRVRHRARTIDASYGSRRHEWLDQSIIESIEEAQDHATQWLRTDNNGRPKIGIRGIAPHRN